MTDDVLNDIEERIVSVDVAPNGDITVGRLPVPTVDEVLEKIEREWTKERFCKDSIARDDCGIPVHFYMPAAKTFCALGAISYYTFDHRGFDDAGTLVDEQGRIQYEFGNLYQRLSVSSIPALQQEYIDVYGVYSEVVRRVEAQLDGHDIPSVNDAARGHLRMMAAVRRARKQLVKEAKDKA